MADSWFRFYNTAVEHPKVLQLNDGHFRSWLRILSLASKLDGKIPDNMVMIGQALRKSPQKAADAVQVLLSVKLLDRMDDYFIPHNWDTKQFRSDNSTDRVKKFRDKSRNATDETVVKRFSNGGDETDQGQSHRQKQKEITNARMARFQTFWDSCPKKTGRGAAEKAWLKAVSDGADPGVIIAKMQAYGAVCIGKDPAYIKTPGPWLNEKRWLDEGTPAPQLAFENTDERGWRDRVRVWRERGGWPAKWGPKPGEEGCKCPPDILGKDAA